MRDQGTAECQAKRAYLINGADPALAATASGILLANGMITHNQHTAALVYARCHSLIYGKPWPCACPLARELGYHGREPPDGLVAWAEARIEEMNARLSPEQRQAVANVAVFGFVPQWFFTERLALRPLQSVESEREALRTGLDALAL